MLAVVRHASAGNREAWSEDDRVRPLDARGREQARRLPELLASLPIRRIVSSPYLRCVQTVEPLAAALGIRIELADELAEGAEAAGVEFLRSLLTEDAVACVHGSMRGALGIDEHFPKGAVWIFEDALDRPRVLIA
jgi:8-oxo-dGTP diphosphatase